MATVVPTGAIIEVGAADAREGVMSSLAVELATSVIITFNLMLYSFVIAFQSTILVIESVSVRGLPANFFYPAFLQNIGVTCAVVGLNFGMTALALVGALLLALAMLIAVGRSHAFYGLIETVLIVAALMSLVAIAAARGGNYLPA